MNLLISSSYPIKKSQLFIPTIFQILINIIYLNILNNLNNFPEYFLSYYSNSITKRFVYIFVKIINNIYTSKFYQHKWPLNSTLFPYHKDSFKHSQLINNKITITHKHNTKSNKINQIINKKINKLNKLSTKL